MAGSADRLRVLLEPRLSGLIERGLYPSAIAGVVDVQNQHVFTCGPAEASPHTDSIFEIASITKVFTSLLLALMHERGLLKLTDSVNDLLPVRARLPETGGRSVSFLDLATHTSGLPSDPTSPYGDHSDEELYRATGGDCLNRPIGAGNEYSNLGFGLLGHLLSLKAGRPYEELVKTWVCEPLGLANTGFALKPHGTDADADETKVVGAGFAAAGGLKSTAADLLRFARAQLGLLDTSLSTAIAFCQIPLRRAEPFPIPGTFRTLAWHVQNHQGVEVFSHEGLLEHSTGGCCSYMAFSRRPLVGLVALAGSPAGDLTGVCHQAMVQLITSPS